MAKSAKSPFHQSDSDEPDAQVQPQQDHGIDLSSDEGEYTISNDFDLKGVRSPPKFPAEDGEGDETIEEIHNSVLKSLKSFQEEAEEAYRPIDAFLDDIIAAEKYVAFLELRIKTKLQLQKLERQFQPGQPLAELWDAHVVTDRLIRCLNNAEEPVVADENKDDEGIHERSGQEDQTGAESSDGDAQAESEEL